MLTPSAAGGHERGVLVAWAPWLVGTPAAVPADQAPRDEELLAAAGEGDLAALATLIGRYQRSLFHAAFHIVGQRADAEDVLQEAFLRVYRGAGGYRGQAPVRAWLYRIVVHLALDVVRRRRFEVPVVEQTAAADGRVDAPDACLDRGIQREEILRAVRLLPPHYRAAFVLRELHGMTYEEIATALRVPVGTVRSRLHVARRRLRESLQRLALDEEWDFDDL